MMVKKFILGTGKITPARIGFILVQIGLLYWVVDSFPKTEPFVHGLVSWLLILEGVRISWISLISIREHHRTKKLLAKHKEALSSGMPEIFITGKVPDGYTKDQACKDALNCIYLVVRLGLDIPPKYGAGMLVAEKFMDIPSSTTLIENYGRDNGIKSDYEGMSLN